MTKKPDNWPTAIRKIIISMVYTGFWFAFWAMAFQVCSRGQIW